MKQDRSARIVIAGHAFVQNRRRGRYELAVEERVRRRLVVGLASWPWRSDRRLTARLGMPRPNQTQQRPLLRCAGPGQTEVAWSAWGQIAKTSSSNATASRRLAGSSTASS